MPAPPLGRKLGGCEKIGPEKIGPRSFQRRNGNCSLGDYRAFVDLKKPGAVLGRKWPVYPDFEIVIDQLQKIQDGGDAEVSLLTLDTDVHLGFVFLMTLTTNLPLIAKQASRQSSKVNRSPPLNDGGESKEEGVSEEGEEFSGSGESFESYEIMDYKYEDGEEFSPQGHRISRQFYDSDCSVHDGHGPLHE
ncbi:hypothetical protein GGI43DRAFT_408909 [Trichoderma evansii]